MTASHLTLRLTDQDAQLIESLRSRTGLSKSDIVKQALRTWAGSEGSSAPVARGLFALGEGSFGKHGDVSRQSADMKSVVRERLDSKRKA